MNTPNTQPVSIKPIRTLECCCCGAEAKGRQWWNRDTGYGICVPCGVRYYANDESAVGKRGIHWDVE